MSGTGEAKNMKPKRRLCPQSSAAAYVDRGQDEPMIRRARLGEESTCPECGRVFVALQGGLTPRHYLSARADES